MAKAVLNLQPSEAVVVKSAAAIYAAYITSGQVVRGKEQEAMHQAIREATYIAKAVDEAIQSDDELS